MDDVILTKHAHEVSSYGSDFSSRLDPGETLSSPAVVVTRGTTTKYSAERGRHVPIGPWVNVSAQFLDGSPQVVGNGVGVNFKARAAAGEQAAGTYVVEVRASTSEGEVLVDTWQLEVTDEAVP